MSDCGHDNAQRNVCAGCHALLQVEVERLRAIIGDTVPLEESSIGRDRAVAVENERLRAELGRLIWVNDEVKRLRYENGLLLDRCKELEALLAAERERCARLYDELRGRGSTTKPEQSQCSGEANNCEQGEGA